MADISKIKPLGSNTTYNIKDNSAIANITRSGTTFTATRRDGTTFTFNQQDNNTWNSLSTSQAGYVAKAPNDTNKFLRGDATWAKVTWDNIDGKPTNFSPSTHTHATSLDIDTGTSQITLAYGEKYKLTTGGTSIIFTMPSTDDTDTHWTTHLYLGNSTIGTGHVSSDITNGNVYLRLYDETTARENINIIGTGATSVTGKNGVITINSTDTNTKVTSVDNHYTPTPNTNSALSVSASGATAAWDIDVVKAVQLQRDAKGHVTGISVTSGKLPSNPNTDYKVRQTNDNTNAEYRLLLSYSANDTEEDNISRKNTNLRYNPSINKLSTGNLDLTGNLQVSGNATLNNNTSIENAIINSLLVNGNSNFINNVNFIQIPTAPTATAGTSTTQIATTEFVTNAVAQGFVANDAMVFKGLIGSNQLITQLPTSGYNAGWTYRVANAGIFAGEYCEVGDLLIAINDGPASGSSVINTDWGKVEHNIDGAVFRGSGASNSSVGSSTQPVYVNGSGIITAITGAIANDTTGNAATATNATQLISNDRMDYGWNGINYFNIFTSNQSAAKVNDTPFSSNVWTHILRFNRNDPNGYYTDLAIPFGQDSIYYKRIAAGSLQNSTTNGGWIKVLDQLNYTSYTVTKTGSGASGTWNINISGNAATATALSSSGTINQFWRGDNRWSDTLGFIKINNEIKIKGYGDNNNYWHTIKDLTTVPLTNDRWHYLPNTTGWIVTSPTNGTGNNTTPIYIGEDGITRAITGTISNNTTGNADTATEFSSNTTVKLTGDATGESAGSKKGWSVPVTLANSGVAAGSYGPSANAEPGYGATFNVPYITVDAKGRVTSASTKTIKIPASDEQDHRDEGYGKITPAGDTGTSAVTANTTQITAKSYNEGFTFKTGNKWLTIAGTESGTTGSDILTIGHKAGLTAKNSYGSTATTASANNGTIKVTDVQYDEAGHITASTDRTITLSQVKNTAGATNSTAKLFLIGATTQGENPQTYSNNGIYIGNNNKQIVIESTSDASIKIRKFNKSDNTDIATISMYVDSSGQKGLYDGKNQKWIFANSADGTLSSVFSHFRPSETNTYNLGSIDRYWNDIYVKDFFTKEATESGTTYRTLMIGNETNRIGRISLYSGSKGGYIQQAINNTNNWILHQLPAESGWIVKAGNGTSTGAGDTETPIYVDTRGVAKPVNALPVNQNLLINTQYYFNNNTSTKPIKKINTQDIPIPDCYSKYDIASSTSVTNLSLGTFAPAPDTWYTLSFYARANYNNTTIRTHFYPDTTASSYNCQSFSTTANDGTSNFTVSTEWKRYWVCYKTSASVSGTKNLIARLISGTSPGTTLRVALPKLEVGQIMTPWVPHANDFSQNKISTCYIDNHELNNYQWHRIATCSVGTTNYDDRDIILFVHKGYLANAFGILKISVRVDTNAVSPPIKLQAKWLLRHGFSESDCLIGLTRNLIDASSAATADIYFKTSTTYARIAFTALNNFNKRFTLFNSDEIAKTENGVKITDLANSTEVYIKENIMNGTTVESIKFKSDASSNTGITYVSWEYASDSLSEKSLIPIANNTYNLGSSSLKWNNIYANNFIGNADTATTASKLSNTSKIGDTNKPVYFKADGTPAAINYTIATSVPSGAVFTDRYVNSAGFADDSTKTAASPVKMTLTRAGSDTVAVTANIPKVSSSSAGVAPKGTAVSSQNQSTKFLREDGTWAAPSYTVNTNTDTLVKQTAKSDNKNYKILFTTSDSPTSGNANEAAYDTNITINPSTHTLTATKFIGSLQGNADTATKASKLSNTSAIGSSTQPVYFNSSGQPVAVNKYDRQIGKTTDFVPRVGPDGVMEIGKYIDFHNTSEDTNDYIVRITARDSSETDGAGLTLTGTTVGTFKGNLNGTATKATQDGNGNNIINTYLTKTAGVTNITWDNTNKKLIKTINNSNSDIVTLYAANLKLNNTAVYNTELEIKNIKIGNGSISTSTKNVKLEYNETLETLNFVFS